MYIPRLKGNTGIRLCGSQRRSSALSPIRYSSYRSVLYALDRNAPVHQNIHAYKVRTSLGDPLRAVSRCSVYHTSWTTFTGWSRASSSPSSSLLLPIRPPLSVSVGVRVGVSVGATWDPPRRPPITNSNSGVRIFGWQPNRLHPSERAPRRTSTYPPRRRNGSRTFRGTNRLLQGNHLHSIGRKTVTCIFQTKKSTGRG